MIVDNRRKICRAPVPCENPQLSKNPTIQMNLTTPNITSLMRQTISKIWHGEYDLLTDNEAITFDNILSAESTHYNLDLGKHLDLKPARYTKLLRDYLDPSAVHRFLQRSKDIATGRAKPGATTALQTRPIRPTDTKHRFGNCILGFTFRNDPTPTIAIHSRTAYITHIGLLDAAIAQALANEISRRVETPSDSARFVWLSTSLQFHTMKSLPWIMLNQPQWLTVPAANKLQAKTQENYRRIIATTAPTAQPSKFGPVRRVQEVAKRIQTKTTRPSQFVTPIGLSPLTQLTGIRT